MSPQHFLPWFWGWGGRVLGLLRHAETKNKQKEAVFSSAFP
jgi:hypothetical protein